MKKFFERRVAKRAEALASRTEYHNWYKKRTWKALRAQRLADEPLCRMCQAQGKIVAASVVDHITPHKGNYELFMDYENTQSLCKPHHDSTKQTTELRGFNRHVGEDGWPTDPNHPANRARASMSRAGV